MSQFSRDPRGARDFSSPQIRIRGAGDFRHYTNQRLRLPNERPPLGPLFRRMLGALVTLAVVGGIGVGVYFGVTELLDEDETVPATTSDAGQQAEAGQVAEPAAETGSPAQQSTPEAQETASAETAQSQDSAAVAAQSGAPSETGAQADSAAAQQVAQENAPEPAAVSLSALAPAVADQPVTSAQIGGAESVAERVTAEAIPSGIPRSLADGGEYDPTEPATAFTSRWPVGTTLRLTRLPGATLLTDEQQQQVIGSQTLVVVRATESSNTDLQLSPAAFDQIAFYGVERIIAVRVEVTAAPPQ